MPPPGRGRGELGKPGGSRAASGEAELKPPSLLGAQAKKIPTTSSTEKFSRLRSEPFSKEGGGKEVQLPFGKSASRSRQDGESPWIFGRLHCFSFSFAQLCSHHVWMLDARVTQTGCPQPTALQVMALETASWVLFLEGGRFQKGEPRGRGAENVAPQLPSDSWAAKPSQVSPLWEVSEEFWQERFLGLHPCTPQVVCVQCAEPRLWKATVN